MVRQLVRYTQKKKSERALLETPWNKIVQNHQSQKVELLGKGLPVYI